MKGVARCVLCRREVEFEDRAPTRCKTREGGCGADKSMSVVRMPRHGAGTDKYDPEGDWERVHARLGEVLRRNRRVLR